MITQLIDVTGVSYPWTSPAIPTQISGPRATLYVMNLSNQTYFLDFGNGNMAHIPPYWARPFCLPSSIKWFTLSVAKSPLGMPNPPFSHVAIETYLLSEDTSHLTSTAINAQVSVQGQTSSTVTTAQSIQNDGNAQQNIIEATPTGASASTIVVDNEGNLTIKGNNAGVLTALLQLVAGASPAVTLGATNVTITANNNLRVNGNITQPANAQITFDAVASIGQGGAGGQAALVANGTNTHINAASGSVDLDVNGTTQVAVNTGGIVFPGTALIGQGGTSGNVITANGGNTYLNGIGALNFQTNSVTGGFFDASQQLNLAHSLVLPNGTLGQLKNFSGTGNGSVATGITNPTTLAFNPCTVSGSSQTIGGTNTGTSTIQTGSGLAWAGTAWHV